MLAESLVQGARYCGSPSTLTGVRGLLSSSSSLVPDGSDSSSWSRGPDTLRVASLGSGVSLSSAAKGGSQAVDRVVGIVAGVYTRLEVQIYCHSPIQRSV